MDSLPVDCAILVLDLFTVAVELSNYASSNVNLTDLSTVYTNEAPSTKPLSYLCITSW